MMTHHMRNEMQKSFTQRERRCDIFREVRESLVRGRESRLEHSAISGVASGIITDHATVTALA